jgi:ParB family transcriptional regulator, chromosome partitioning protein
MASKRNSDKIHQIPCTQIVPGSNDRKVFDEIKLRELATSIQEHGLAQPITVRPIEGKQQYEIVAGERRFRAISEVLQWETAPCLVRELSDEEASAIMLVENTSRVDLDPIAEANAYQVRVTKFEWDAKRIAEVAGVSVERVRARLQLLRLAEDIQHFVRTNAFPIGHALTIVDLDMNRQRIALRVFNAAKSMPLSRFQEIVQELISQQIEESQLDMFADFWVKQVTDEPPTRRGKHAKTGAPIAHTLPSVKITGKDSTGDILDRYITELLQQGHAEAAAAIGNVYNALVAGNWVSVPVNSVLAKTAEGDATAGDAPVQEL